MASPDVRDSGVYMAPDVFASGNSVDFAEPAEPSEESVPVASSSVNKELSFFTQSTGSCNAMSAQHLVHGDWTFADLKKLTTSDFFGTGKLNTQLHMSDIYSGDISSDPENVTGWICFESLGEFENRRFAGWLDDNCVKTLKISKDKCEALEEVVETYAKDTKFVAALKEAGRDGRLIIAFTAVAILSAVMLTGRGGGGGHGGGGISRKTALMAIGGLLAAVGAISAALQLFARKNNREPSGTPYYGSRLREAPLEQTLLDELVMALPAPHFLIKGAPMIPALISAAGKEIAAYAETAAAATAAAAASALLTFLPEME